MVSAPKLSASTAVTALSALRRFISAAAWPDRSPTTVMAFSLPCALSKARRHFDIERPCALPHHRDAAAVILQAGVADDHLDRPGGHIGDAEAAVFRRYRPRCWPR
jgi:hypothetical protein